MMTRCEHDWLDRGTTEDEWREQLASLTYQMGELLKWLGIDIPAPEVDDSPAALLAEPHLSGLTGSAEDLADLLPRRPAGLCVPSLSGDLPTERGVENVQGVQGVQLPSDMTEVVGQSVEDRGSELVADRVVVPVGDHEVSEDVPQPAEGLAGAVVSSGVVVDGESGDCHDVKGALTSRPCQDGLDA